MKEKVRKQRFALILLVSIFVFVTITIAAALSIGIIHLMLLIGVIDSFEGQTNWTDIIIFVSFYFFVDKQ